MEYNDMTPVIKFIVTYKQQIVQTAWQGS